MLQEGKVYKLTIRESAGERNKPFTIKAKVIKVKKNFVILEKQHKGKKLYNECYFHGQIQDIRVVI